MSSNGLLIMVILGLIIIVLIVLVIIISKMKSTKPKQENFTKIKTISDYINIAADKNSTREDLKNAIIEVSQNLPFPPKNDKDVPSSARVYLDFVILVTKHKNVDAKLIAFMDKELKQKNPTYKREIDIYENQGIDKRQNQQ